MGSLIERRTLMDNKKRILIVDDNPLLREALWSLLSSHQDFDIVGETGDGLEAIEFVEKLKPDLILMDISMPKMEGLAATRNIKKKWPDTKILIFTVNKSPEYVSTALMIGADGYVLKDAPGDVIINCINSVLAGERVVCSDKSEEFKLQNQHLHQIN